MKNWKSYNGSAQLFFLECDVMDTSYDYKDLMYARLTLDGEVFFRGDGFRIVLHCECMVCFFLFKKKFR